MFVSRNLKIYQDTMKYTTIYLNENTIEIFNSIIGRETIKLNGEIVSSKFSITGTEHHFRITENEEEADCKIITGFGLSGVVIDLYKNNEPIIESPKMGCVGVFLVTFLILTLISLYEKFFS